MLYFKRKVTDEFVTEMHSQIKKAKQATSKKLQRVRTQICNGDNCQVTIKSPKLKSA